MNPGRQSRNQTWKLCLTRRRKDAKVSAPGGCRSFIKLTQELSLSVYSEYSVVLSCKSVSISVHPWFLSYTYVV